MGAIGPKCNFFLQIYNKVPGRGRAGARGACRLPLGRPGGPPTSATGGPVAPPLGRPALAPLYRPLTPISSSFEPKNSTKKSRKNKKGEKKGSGEALPDCKLVICR